MSQRALLRAGLIAALILPGFLLAGTGCFARKAEPEVAPQPPPPEPPPELAPEPVPDPRLAELTEKNRKLELTLLEKESQIKDLDQRMAEQKRRYDEAIQEVVRAKAKLRSLESRAEAASQMAETEIAFKALNESGGGSPNSELLQIEQMMTMSVTEFEKQNFGGALYLSLQAKELIQDGQRKISEMGGIQAESGEIAFSVPLTLQASRSANVRQEPGLSGAIVVTLKEGSPVIGYSHKGDWIRVKMEDGTQGWVHQSLLAVR